MSEKLIVIDTENFSEEEFTKQLAVSLSHLCFNVRTSQSFSVTSFALIIANMLLDATGAGITLGVDQMAEAMRKMRAGEDTKLSVKMTQAQIAQVVAGAINKNMQHIV